MKKLLFVILIMAVTMFAVTSVASAERGIFGKHWMDNTIHKLVTSNAYDPTDPGNSPGWKAWAKKWLKIYKRTTINLNEQKAVLDLPLSRCVLQPKHKPTTWHELGTLHKKYVKIREESIEWCRWALKWKTLAQDRVAMANNEFKAESARELGWAYKRLTKWLEQKIEELGYMLKD